jgi:hypothetical protein
METSPNVGSNSSNGDTDGDKWVDLSNLQYSTNYTVYVNVTGSQRNETYYFETESGQNDTVDVTLTPSASANISVNRSTWLPSAGLGGNELSGATWANLDNTGTIQVDVTVNATDTSEWTLEASPGHNQFNLSFTLGSGYTAITTTQSVFKNDIAYNESQDFGLRVYMPTSSSSNSSQQTTITFVATVD